MDELDQFKKQWKEQQHFDQVNQSSIKAMLHKSSSSIVKWVFIISCIEFLGGIFLSFVLPETKEEHHPQIFEISLTIASLAGYIAIIYFMYNFFTSYRKIKTSNSTKEILNDIINTRKQVENYIKFNIYYLMVVFFILFVQISFETFNPQNPWGMSLLKIVTLLVIFSLIGLFFVWIYKIYFKIVYRRLIKKLNNNYEELEKLEEE